jgi:hypothetical protein
MGFNRRKMEDQRRLAAEKKAVARRATDAQVLEDAEQLIAAWNERQTKRMPMLFSPTIALLSPRFATSPSATSTLYRWGSLIALDPNRPIREADIAEATRCGSPLSLSRRVGGL